MGEFKAINLLDDAGNPTGGSVDGIGLDIEWQDGPLGTGEDRKLPNGAFVETVIAAIVQRLEFFQESKFACDENQMAIDNLKQALEWLDQRTRQREKMGLEGTHQV